MLRKIKEIFSVFDKEKNTKKALDQFLKELQKILISSDVEIKTVIEISNKIREKFKEEYIPGANVEIVVKKILLDVLGEILGPEGSYIIKPKTKPCFILMVGLYGHGKTTTTAKMARYLTNKGYKVACLELDTQRPGAYQQLSQLCAKAGIEIFGDPNEKDPLKIYEKFKDRLKDYSIVVVDTSGRDDISDDLVEEISRINKALAPQETFLVIDAAIGRVAKRMSEKFKDLLNITGVIVTKFDSTAKGGGALVAANSTKAPVVFIGTGERLEDFEEFDKKKFLQRLLGLGDIDSLYKQFEKIVQDLRTEEQEFEEAANRMFSGKMRLKDFYLLLRSMTQQSSIDKLFSFLPSFGIKQDNVLGLATEKINKYLIILQSLRKSELEDHRKILRKRERILEIAIGSGTTEEDVKSLITDFNRIKNQTKALLSNRELRTKSLRFLSKFNW